MTHCAGVIIGHYGHLVVGLVQLFKKIFIKECNIGVRKKCKNKDLKIRPLNCLNCKVTISDLLISQKFGAIRGESKVLHLLTC